MKKIIALLLAAVLALAVFASCGSSNKAQKVKVIDIALSEESYAFAVSKEDATLLTKTNEFLKKIKDDGTFDQICNNYFGDGTPVKVASAKLDSSKDQLVVATATGFEPFEMVDTDGKFYGIDMEIAAKLAEYLGKELVIQDMEFASVVTSVQQKICDIGMAGLSITPARQEVVNFSNSYYSANQVLIVKGDNTKFDSCKTAEDVVKILDTFDKSTKIGCQTGTTGEIYIVGDASDPDGYGFKGTKCTKMGYTYVALAVTAMINGEIDYVIVDDAPAKAVTAKINAG